MQREGGKIGWREELFWSSWEAGEGRRGGGTNWCLGCEGFINRGRVLKNKQERMRWESVLEGGGETPLNGKKPGRTRIR